MEMEIDALLAAWRRRIKVGWPRRRGATKVSVNDMVIKACGQGVAAIHPECNVSWTEDEIKIQTASVDISVAVPHHGSRPDHADRAAMPT